MVDFIDERYLVVGVVGPHAGESEEEILARKAEEIQKCGLTFWLYKSFNAKPRDVQRLCEKSLKGGGQPLCLFIESGSKGGSQATVTANRADEFSRDGEKWQKITQEILVTGSIKNSSALVLNDLEVIKSSAVLDLWNYSDFGLPGRAVRIRRGGSTICCEKGSSRADSKKMVSNVRRILAVGKLAPPFGVWLR